MDQLTQFHALREIRNAVIHAGGIVDQRILRCVAGMSVKAQRLWRHVAGRSPQRLVLGARAELGAGEILLTLVAGIGTAALLDAAATRGLAV